MKRLISGRTSCNAFILYFHVRVSGGKGDKSFHKDTAIPHGVREKFPVCLPNPFLINEEILANGSSRSSN